MRIYKPDETSNSSLENDKNSNLRKAAIEARKRITNQLKDDPVSIPFASPGVSQTNY